MTLGKVNFKAIAIPSSFLLDLKECIFLSILLSWSFDRKVWQCQTSNTMEILHRVTRISISLVYHNKYDSGIVTSFKSTDRWMILISGPSKSVFTHEVQIVMIAITVIINWPYMHTREEILNKAWIVTCIVILYSHYVSQSNESASTCECTEAIGNSAT